MRNNQQLTGGLEALRGCTNLVELYLDGNQLAPTEEDTAHFKEQCVELAI